jgi:molybdopterin-containing oxidoreductase family iron-sulfur binding subunit
MDDQLQPKAVRKAGPGNSSEEHEAHNRNLVRVGTPEVFREHPDFVKKMEGEAAEKPVLSLYPEFEYPAYKWGMSINLNACIGCNACVVACQAENNIPVVGKTEAARGRAMHWIRVDDYFQGPPEAPELYHMPVPCMHCEKAPCEPVCPVGATLHDSEGLNEMVYNRCVGTRYCSNNCPYKVRRFNYLDYTRTDEPTLKMQRNPDVTVRSRGVMEKCTYCIQRISAARIEADKESRPIRDGEVVPACAQACPTQAIIFGNLNDRSAQVTKLKSSPLDYGVLTELTTQPRTTYMPRFRNPNPELEDEGTA